MTFLLGFKMVPSLTCTVEPEAGDVRMRVCQRNRPCRGWRWEGVMWGHLGLGARVRGSGTKSAPDSAT